MPTRYDVAGYWRGNDNPATADTFGYDDYPTAPTALQLSLADEIVASGLTPVLIAGCGPGLLVAELRSRGVAAWGADVSPWAAANEATGAAGFIYGERDLRNAGQARQVMRDVDPALVVSEDLIGCLTDAEAQTLDGFLRGWRTDPAVWHFVSAHQIHCNRYGDPVEPCPYNTAGREPDPVTGIVQLRTLAEWRTLLGPEPRLIDHHGEVP